MEACSSQKESKVSNKHQNNSCRTIFFGKTNLSRKNLKNFTVKDSHIKTGSLENDDVIDTANEVIVIDEHVGGILIFSVMLEPSQKQLIYFSEKDDKKIQMFSISPSHNLIYQTQK